MTLDETIFFFFYNLAHQSVFADQLIIFFAVYFPYLVILSAGFFLVFYYGIFTSKNIFQQLLKHFSAFFALALSAVLAWAVAKALKLLFHTARPFEILSQVDPLFRDDGYAFPSGHALVFSAIAFTLFFVNKKAGYLFMFFVFLIGVARVAAGAHFPIDILGGFLFGVLISWLVVRFLPKCISVDF